jgi:hypothetical protein
VTLMMGMMALFDSLHSRFRFAAVSHSGFGVFGVL